MTAVAELPTEPLVPGEALPPLAPVAGPHPNLDHDISPWLDEQMWGHRLWDAESPWLVFLEFLTVAEACERDGRLLEAGGAYPLTFRPQQRMFLRNILFNSDDAQRVADEVRDSRRAWEMWLARMGERARAVPHRDFSYLRPRFHSFDEFARVVRLLRSGVVERESNKRWTSRFLFPFGRHALYEDLNFNEATNSATREYINFGRTGELLYLMLCRSGQCAELAPYLATIVDGSGKWDRLVASLQPEGGDEQALRGKSYLPYATHPVFDDLAEDWLAISRLHLPPFDAYPHLVALAGLHLLRYHLAVGAAWAGHPSPPTMLCEIVAPRKTLVRELSLGSYAQNDALSTEAIERFVDGIRATPAWQEAAVGNGAFVRCRELLRQWVWWGDDYDGANDPEALLRDLRTVALKRHRQHVAQFHRSFGRQIGLVSRRGTTRLRYAPTDELMESLLLANVSRRMEFGEFLQRLFERYGLVIGDREAERVLATEDFDRKAFQRNAHRLEQRLASLGLLRRLSDACAYVINPYSGSATR
jgi:hypothetical protein